MNVIRFKTILIVGLLSMFGFESASATATAGSPSILSIIRTETIGSLDRLVGEQKKSDQKTTSCAFQNKNGLPPTFCFRAEMSAEERVRMTESCVLRAKRARAIPATDEWTDGLCRLALEERRRDLEYSDR